MSKFTLHTNQNVSVELDAEKILDCLVDKGLGDSLLVDEKEIEKLLKVVNNPAQNTFEANLEAQTELDGYTYLGNAGEYADLTNVYMAEVMFKTIRDLKLLLAFAEAKGANVENLDQIKSNN